MTVPVPTGLTRDYPLLLAARAAVGVTGAFFFIVGGVMATRLAARAHSPVPLGIYFAGAGLGIAVSGAAIPPLLGPHPARWPLAWAGLAGAAPAAWHRPISGWPGGRPLAVLLIVLAAASVLALVSPAPVVVAGSALAYGGTFLSVPAAVTGLIRHMIPAASWTGALAAFTVVFAAGQTAGPYLAGMLADRFGTGATLTWTAGLCAAGAVCAMAVRRQAEP